MRAAEVVVNILVLQHKRRARAKLSKNGETRSRDGTLDCVSAARHGSMTAAEQQNGRTAERQQPRALRRTGCDSEMSTADGGSAAAEAEPIPAELHRDQNTGNPRTISADPDNERPLSHVKRNFQLLPKTGYSRL